MYHRSRRYGFTLVELLVVIAIIGILIALLLPAVQAAREAARRMTCTNHLKQVALAYHNYNDAHKLLPLQWAQRGSTAAGRPSQSALTAVLPFIEQTALYDAVMSMTPMREPWRAGQDGGEPWRAEIPIFLCPSDSSGRSGNAPGRTNVRVSTGDWAYPVGSGDNNFRGVFGMNQIHFRLQGASDGTSNTIVVSERIIGLSQIPKAGIGVQPGVFNGTAANAGVLNPQLCLNLPVNGSIPADQVCVPWNGSLDLGYPVNISGISWGDGYSVSIAFQTILPPNAPGCAPQGTAGQDSVNNLRVLLPPTSNHTGGVNIGLLDGSVHFVSDTVNTGTLTSPPRTDGPSPYGIWGAYGTPAGNDTVGSL